jgi:hypothetical protein
MSVTGGSRRKQRTPGQAKGPKGRPRTTPETEKGETLRRAAINVFILFHLIAITCVAVPGDFSPLRNVGELVGPYMLWTGLFQRWDMFAPDPTAVNSYVKAVVISGDRHMHVWSFPRMEELGFAERYRKERYRKFLEVLPQQQNAPLWPDVARHVARQFSSQTDPPDKVLLIEFQSDIHPSADGSPDLAPRPNVFYEDYVQPGGLP